MTDIIDRLRDGSRRGRDAVREIETLRNALRLARPYVKMSHPGDVQADADLRTIDDALASELSRPERGGGE